MGLENYTRGQKIFFGTLIVVLATTFTVSGAMITIFDAGRQAPPSEAAEIDGNGIGYAEYHRKLQALNAIKRLDRASYGSQDIKESLYAKVPALSTSEIAGYTVTGNPDRPFTIGLLDVWPQWQDQHLFCHFELVRRAREAGVELPSNTRVGNLVFQLMNAGRSDAEKFQQKDIEKEFKRNFGSDLSDFMPTIREGMMVRDYVEALLAEKGATLDQVAQIVAGDNEEYRADFVRLSIDPFLARATEEVKREHFAWRASRLAGGMGVSTLGFGTDPLEEAFDKNRNIELQAEARFTFDMIRAFPRDMLARGRVPVEAIGPKVGSDATGRLALTYLAVRDEMFTASEEDKKDIEKRLEAAKSNEQIKNPASRDWTADQWKTWTDKQREELQKYRSQDEARGDLESMLRSQNSVPAAQFAISELRRRLEDERKRNERNLNAALDVQRKDMAVDQGVKDYYYNVRQNFTRLEEQIGVRLSPVLARIPASPTAEDARRLADEFTRVLEQLDREQLATLNTAASLMGQNLEQQRDDKSALKEEFQARRPEDRRNDADLPMTEAEAKAKLDGFDLDMKALTLRIEAREATASRVEKVVAGLRAMIAALDLEGRAIVADGDARLRVSALGRLIIEAQARLAKYVKDSGEEIVPQSLVDKWDGNVQLKQADIDGRQAAMSKEAGDTRNLTLDAWAAELGLEFVGGTRSMTWRDVLADGRLRELESADGAKAFLEEPSNTAGMTSGLLTLPGKGYLILRLREKTPKYSQSRADASDRVIKMAALQRARKYAIDAVEEIRRDMLKNGWDAALKRAQEKHGADLSTGTTEWFTDKMDLPGIYSEGDSDLLSFSASPSATAPDQPFMTRLRDVPSREGITELIPEKRNDDPQRRPDADQWSYMVARLAGRRPYTKRMDESAVKEQGYGNAPSEMWRNRHLAGSDIVRELLTPHALLGGQKIVLHKTEQKDNDNQPADEAGK